MARYRVLSPDVEENTPPPPSSPPPSAGRGRYRVLDVDAPDPFTRGAVHGLSLGWSDELQSLFGGDLEAARARTRQAQEISPGTFGAARFLGGGALKLIGDVDPELEIHLDEDEAESILQAANLVTLARTGVEFDHRGEIIDAHAPEMPTRFAKQLTQLVRGAIAIGMPRGDALALAIRCARDSMPPLRLEILQNLTEHPDSQTLNIARRLNKPRSTVRRQVQALHLLGVLMARVEEKLDGKDVSHYRLVDELSLDSLLCPEK